MTDSDREQIERELEEEFRDPLIRTVPVHNRVWDALLSREIALREAQKKAKEVGYGSGSLASVIDSLADCSAKAMEQAEAAESALREARKWPTELAKVTGLGEHATPKETADQIAANANLAIEWRDKLEAAETALREAQEEVTKYKEVSGDLTPEQLDKVLDKKFANMGLPELGDLAEYACRTEKAEKDSEQVRKLLRRANEALQQISKIADFTTASIARTALSELAEAVLSPAPTQACWFCGEVHTPECAKPQKPTPAQAEGK